MDITCPHCHQKLEGDESLVGEIVDCPNCTQSFVVGEIPTKDEGNSESVGIVSLGEPQSVNSDNTKETELVQGVNSDDEPEITVIRTESTQFTGQTISSSPSLRGRFLRLSKRVQVIAVVIAVIATVFSVLMGRQLLSSSHLDIKPIRSEQEAHDYYDALLDKDCDLYDYKDIMRFPDQFKGKELLVRGYVTKVFPMNGHKGQFSLDDKRHDNNDWRVIFDDMKTWKPKGNILEGDELRICGTLVEVWEWSEKNAFGVPIQGRTPILKARLILGYYD